MPSDILEFISEIKRTFEQRANEANCQSQPIHIMSRQLFEVLENPDTPDNIKHRILLATYIGEQCES